MAHLKKEHCDQIERFLKVLGVKISLQTLPKYLVTFK